jgi:hypothetical protein
VTQLAASKLTTAGMLLGTPEYMAPEQIECRDDIDARADVWAMGITLYQLVAGAVPFTGETLLQIFDAVMEAHVPFPTRARGLDGGLWSILTDCLRRDRDERFASVEEVERALTAWLAKRGVTEDYARHSLVTAAAVRPSTLVPTLAIPRLLVRRARHAPPVPPSTAPSFQCWRRSPRDRPRPSLILRGHAAPVRSLHRGRALRGRAGRAPLRHHLPGRGGHHPALQPGRGSAGRLDRNQVVGKNFFARVAPCTAGPAFEGRFREFARASGGQDVLRFDYLFDFKFGAQEVGIEIVRAPSGDRFYLFVNRRKFFEARRDLPEGFAAPLQRELAPNEQAEGVRRDDVDRRVLEVPWSFLSALRTTCDQVAPEGWPLFCTAWGTQWGRSVAVDLETEALEAFQLSIREVPLRTAMEMLSRGMARQGWGALRIDFSYTPQSAFVAHLDRSAVAEAAARSKTMRCHMVSGMLGAVFTHIASRRVVAREVTCKARGDASCTFVVVPDSRRSALESAIQAGLTDVGTVVRSLKRESLRG